VKAETQLFDRGLRQKFGAAHRKAVDRVPVESMKKETLETAACARSSVRLIEKRSIGVFLSRA